MSEDQVAAPQEAPSDDWKAQLPEDLRENAAIQPFQDVENLARGYVNAASMIGRDKIVVPGQHSTPEDWADVYDKLGRPESHEAYELNPGEEPNEELLTWFKNTAHEIGLNNNQAQQLMDKYNALAANQAEAAMPDIDAIQNETRAQLKQEYGNAMEDRLSMAKAMLTEHGIAEIAEIPLADGSMLGDNAEFLKSMIGIGEFIREKVSEDQYVGGEGRSSARTPAQLQDRLLELEAPTSPIYDSRHPQRDAYLAERAAIYEELYPEDDEAA